MATAASPRTAESILLNPPPERWELVKGELRTMSPAKSMHGYVVGRVTVQLGAFVLRENLGVIFGAETRFFIERNPDTVRAPDLGFVRADRIPGELPDSFFPGAPDIAVEVLSPSDSASEVEEKAEDWLRAGCVEVWLIDPRRQRAVKCTRSGTSIQHEPVEILRSELLPGFELRVPDRTLPHSQL